MFPIVNKATTGHLMKVFKGWACFLQGSWHFWRSV